MIVSSTMTDKDKNNWLRGKKFRLMELIKEGVTTDDLKGLQMKDVKPRSSIQLVHVAVDDTFGTCRSAPGMSEAGSDLALSGHDRMDQAIGKARIEHDVPPAFARENLPVGSHFEACGRLHPAIH